MFSCPNHHHSHQCGNSEPPLQGTQHCRSPDSMPSEHSEQADPAEQVPQSTKSPHTHQIIKCGHTDSTLLDNAPTTPPSQSPARPTHAEEPTSPATPTLSSGSVTEHLQHLELLLDSVLAMVVILNTMTTTPVYSAHMRDAVIALSTLFCPKVTSAPEVDNPNPPSAPDWSPQTCKSYAMAAALPPAKPTPAHAPSAAPAGKWHRVTPPPHHSHSAHWLILWWLTVETPSPETFVPTQFVEDLMSEFSNIHYNQLQLVTTDPITLGHLDRFQLKSGWLEMSFQSSTNQVSTILCVYNYTSLIFCSVQFIL